MWGPTRNCMNERCKKMSSVIFFIFFISGALFLGHISFAADACVGEPLSAPQTEDECRNSTDKGCPSRGGRPFVGWRDGGWANGPAFKCCCGPRPVIAYCPSGKVCLGNPLNTSDIPTLIGRVLRMVFGLIGTIALVIFIYGGALWMTAFGEESKVKKGWDTMIWGAIGLVVIFGSYVAVDFILKAILGS